MPADKWAQYADKPASDPWAQYADKPVQMEQAVPDLTNAQVVGKGASDLIQGIGEGALNTVHGIGEGLRAIGNYGSRNSGHPGEGDRIIPPVGQTALAKIATPDNTMQSIGKFGEQAGEMMIPVGAEAGAARLLPKAGVIGKIAQPLGRIAANAIETGVKNKIQGGDFKTGAEGGAGGEILGMGLQKAAPAMAETALGIGNKLRGNGRTIGRAALDETSALRPVEITKQAGTKLSALTDTLENSAAASTSTARSTPAHQVIDNAIAKAPRNARGYIDKLQSLKPMLELTPGSQKRNFTASEILEMKRGVNKEISNWAPEIRRNVEGVKKQIYRALDGELDRTVPGAEGLNQRISSLIPVKQRAEQLTRNAGLGQRISHRIAAHTGALAGATVGGIGGYERGGTTGALIGGTTGLILPEVLSSPSARMGLARAANSKIPARLLTRTPLQADR